jgi:hypothetical protein
LTASGCHLSGVAANVAPSGVSAAGSTTVVARFAKLEIELSHGDVRGSNAPFIDFISASGRVARVFGFPSNDRWKFRFAPPELGEYRYEARPAPDGAVVAAGGFRADPSPDHGLVRIDPAEHHRLRFDDGTPFFVLGENRINVYDRTWNYGHKSAADYIATMAGYGMNTLRVFIFADCKSESTHDHAQPGCIEPKLGRFDEKVAREFDAIFEAAEAHGIYVILTAFAIGFSPGDSWKNWADNPYNVVNGGPATRNTEVFTRDDLRAASKRKLRYLLDRYGYSSHLLAIDLINEPEWDGQIPERIWIPWAQDLARDWKQRDPYGHLVTVGSIGLSSNIDGDERPLYASPDIDLVQWHLYGAATYDPRAHADEMVRRVRETWGFDKPIFCGEFAYGGEDPALYDHTHTGIWAAIFAGGGALAHSAPPFHRDSDEPMTPARGRHFRVLADFLGGLDGKRRLEPDPAAVARPVGTAVWALGSGDYRVLWIVGPAASYGQPIANAVVTLRDVPAGRYQTEWRDDVSGQVLATVDLSSRGGDLDLKLPTFTRHLAGKLFRTP